MYFGRNYPVLVDTIGPSGSIYPALQSFVVGIKSSIPSTALGSQSSIEPFGIYSTAGIAST